MDGLRFRDLGNFHDDILGGPVVVVRGLGGYELDGRAATREG